MTTLDESLSTVESSTNILIDQPPRFSLRSYLPRSASKIDIAGGCCTGCLVIIGLFVILVVVPIKMIIVGNINTAHCPIQAKIPIVLIVSGIVALVSILLCIGIISIKLADILYIFGVCLCYIEVILHIFWIIWIILGIAWKADVIKSVQHTNTSLPTYCDKNTFESLSVYLPMQGALAIISFCVSGLCCWFNKY
jgi:hypothetical protein